MIRHWHAPGGYEVGESADEFLRVLGGPAWLHLAGNDRSRMRAISTLLHGNEPSGVRALHRFLKSGRKPATDVLVLVASVDAALAAPGFAHRTLPGRKDLNRCFADSGLDLDARLARAILGELRTARPEALVDLHNTSGSGPAYGVGIRADPAHLSLTSLFASIYVLTDIRLGALMEVTEDAFPVVTIECGGAHDRQSDEIAVQGMTQYLCAETVLTRADIASSMTVLKHPIRVRLMNGGQVAYARARDASRILTLRDDIDRFNSAILPPREPIGWTDSLDRLTAIDGRGVERREVLLEVRAGRLYAKQALRLFMATTDAHIAMEDCLFYAMSCDDPCHDG